MSNTLPNIEALLGGISTQQFLDEYWQKKPLLIRQAIPGYHCPINADELAGLAMEEEVESRIIQEHGEHHAWSTSNGPFCENDFSELPETHWTLLIQQLDAWCPEINELKQAFSFIPNWRIDDIMASYAPQGGSVGPHFDQYDVFLLQAEGKRHWRTGQVCDEHSPSIQGTSLRILEQFEEVNNWVLEPGDMLYLPPQIAHYGIALGVDEGQGDCITLSIGFRAPTHQQILSDFSDHQLESIPSTSIYEDPDLALQTHSGEISDHALAKIQQIINQYSQNPTQLKKWFGKFSTQAKNEHCLESPDEQITTEELLEFIEHNELIFPNEGSRFAYSESSREGEQLSLLFFVDGHCFELDAVSPEIQALNIEFVQTLCEMRPLSKNQQIELSKHPQIVQVLLDLLHNGSLYFETLDYSK